MDFDPVDSKSVESAKSLFLHIRFLTDS
jgi:hypothetical protein